MNQARLVVAATALIAPAAAVAQTTTCSTWQGIETCTDSHGYLSRESQWGDFVYGSDNRGNSWTGSTWQGVTTWSVKPGRGE